MESLVFFFFKRQHRRCDLHINDTQYKHEKYINSHRVYTQHTTHLNFSLLTESVRQLLRSIAALSTARRSLRYPHHTILLHNDISKCPRDPEYMAPFKFIDVPFFPLHTRSLSLVRFKGRGGGEVRATASFFKYVKCRYTLENHGLVPPPLNASPAPAATLSSPRGG